MAYTQVAKRQGHAMALAIDQMAYVDFARNTRTIRPAQHAGLAVAIGQRPAHAWRQFEKIGKQTPLQRAVASA